MLAGNPSSPRLGRVPWAVVIFLTGFSALLLLVCWYYLLPAADAYRDADKLGKHKLAATSSLLLAVILFVMLVGMMMTFRVRRFFFPRPTPKPTKTDYVDAWAESGKRLQIDDDDDE
jgi:hypothetical protein